MQRLTAGVLIGAGISLIALGTGTESFAAHLSSFFTEQPTDRSVWAVILGAAALVIGSGAAVIPARLGPR